MQYVQIEGSPTPRATRTQEPPRTVQPVAKTPPTTLRSPEKGRVKTPLTAIRAKSVDDLGRRHRGEDETPIPNLNAAKALLVGPSTSKTSTKRGLGITRTSVPGSFPETAEPRGRPTTSRAEEGVRQDQSVAGRLMHGATSVVSKAWEGWRSRGSSREQRDEFDPDDGSDEISPSTFHHGSQLHGASVMHEQGPERHQRSTAGTERQNAEGLTVPSLEQDNTPVSSPLIPPPPARRTNTTNTEFTTQDKRLRSLQLPKGLKNTRERYTNREGQPAKRPTTRGAMAQQEDDTVDGNQQEERAQGQAGPAQVVTAEGMKELQQSLECLVTDQLARYDERLARLEATASPIRSSQRTNRPSTTPRGARHTSSSDSRFSPEIPTILPPVDRTRYRGWKTKDVGFFYPDAPEHMGEGDRMVTAFAHRVRMYARMHPASPLRENLDGLLEGTAQEWWTDAVEEEEQLYYMTQADGIEAWLKHLEEHFAPSPEEAEAHLEALTYTPADARKGKSVEEYLASIRAAVRAFNEDARDADIVYRAWKQLHPRLRRKVDRPEKTVTFAELRRLLKTKQPTWKTLPEKDGDVPG
ncbi:hypothetical protein KEM56_004027, partial [Ascosphaera pollenicola]